MRDLCSNFIHVSTAPYFGRSHCSGLRFRPYFITNLLHGGVESRAANTFRTRTLPRFRGTPVFNQDFKVRLGGPTDVLQFQLFNNRRLRRDPMVRLQLMETFM